MPLVRLYPGVVAADLLPDLPDGVPDRQAEGSTVL